MKCGPIYKQASLIADGQYDGTMTGYEVKFKTETGEFMTRSLHYGIRGMNVPVVVTGDPTTENSAGIDRATLVTVPPAAAAVPHAVRTLLVQQ